MLTFTCHLKHQNCIRQRLETIDSKDSTSLTFNSIFDLYKDQNNNLWVNYVSRGYDMINPKTFQISKPKKKAIEGNTKVLPEYLFIKNKRTFIGPRNEFNTNHKIDLTTNNRIFLINDSSYYILNILNSYIE